MKTNQEVINVIKSEEIQGYSFKSFILLHYSCATGANRPSQKQISKELSAIREALEAS